MDSCKVFVVDTHAHALNISAPSLGNSHFESFHSEKPLKGS